MHVTPYAYVKDDVGQTGPIKAAATRKLHCTLQVRGSWGMMNMCAWCTRTVWYGKCTTKQVYNRTVWPGQEQQQDRHAGHLKLDKKLFLASIGLFCFLCRGFRLFTGHLGCFQAAAT